MKIRRIDFYPDDWITGTVGLHADEIGVYITICALIYAHGGPVAIDVVKSWCSSHGNAFNRIMGRLEILGKIIRKGSEIDQKRCENELERARNRLRKASENGAKGGRPNGLEKAAGFANQKANKQQTTNNNQQKEESPLFAPPPRRGETKPSPNGVHKNGAARGTRLPPDWSPTLNGREFCFECGLEPDETFSAFRDHWLAKPGADATKLDWEATWRNWCRNQKRFNGSARGSRDAAHDRRARGREALMRAVLERS